MLVFEAVEVLLLPVILVPAVEMIVVVVLLVQALARLATRRTCSLEEVYTCMPRLNSAIRSTRWLLLVPMMELLVLFDFLPTRTKVELISKQSCITLFLLQLYTAWRRHIYPLV